MIIHELSGADWLLGQESAISPEQQAADMASSGPPNASGVPAMDYQAAFPATGAGTGASGSGSGIDPSKLLAVGKEAYSKATTSTKSGTSDSVKNKVTVCRKHYDECKAFITDPVMAAKYKALVASNVAHPAWQTYKRENLACNAKFESGAFGPMMPKDWDRLKREQNEDTWPAYVKYRACQQTALKKYNTSVPVTSPARQFVSAFRMAMAYVRQVDAALAMGRTEVPSTCATAKIAATQKMVSTARAYAKSSTTTNYVIGALVIGAAAFVAWKIL